MDFIPSVYLLVVSFISASYSQSSKHENRILGGILETEYIPYQVALYVDGKFACGGALITNDCVITAAHCVHNKPAPTLRVRGGILDLNSKDGVPRMVSQKFVSNNYDSKTTNYDVAILKLSRPMTGANIKPVRLNNKGIASGEKVRVSGWGSTKEGRNKASIRLRAIVVPILSENACRKAYPKEITKNMFCAGVPKGGRDSCTGDSGGPAVKNNTLYGIVSWGDGCGRANSPGVYTNVRRVLPWIKNIKSRNCSNI